MQWNIQTQHTHQQKKKEELSAKKYFKMKMVVYSRSIERENHFKAPLQ